MDFKCGSAYTLPEMTVNYCYFFFTFFIKSYILRLTFIPIIKILINQKKITCISENCFEVRISKLYYFNTLNNLQYGNSY